MPALDQLHWLPCLQTVDPRFIAKEVALVADAYENWSRPDKLAANFASAVAIIMASLAKSFHKLSKAEPVSASCA